MGGCVFMFYLQIVQHSEGRHARGWRSEEGLQDRCSTGLVLLLGAQRGRTGACTLEQCLLQGSEPEGVSIKQRYRHLGATMPSHRSHIYLVAPDTGFFGNKVVQSILHFRICWNEQQQIPHPKSDPGDFKKNKRTWKSTFTGDWGANPFRLYVYLDSSRLASW